MGMQCPIRIFGWSSPSLAPGIIYKSNKPGAKAGYTGINEAYLQEVLLADCHTLYESVEIANLARGHHPSAYSGMYMYLCVTHAKGRAS